MKGSKRSFFSKRILSNLVVVCAGILLFLLLFNFKAVWEFVEWVAGIFSPFVTALTIAYLLNIPVRFFEDRVFVRMKRRHGLSVLISYVLAFFLVALLLGLVLPQVVESVVTLVGNIPSYLANLNDLLTWLTERFPLTPDNYEFLLLSYQEIVTEIVQQVRTALPGVLNWTLQVGSGIIGGLTALIASIYMLLSRDKLLRQCKKVLYAFLPKRRTDEILRVGRLANGVFSGFIGGKIIDSVIIGGICFVFMSAVNAWFLPMPFAPLISIVIGITNIIPFFGPFIGAVPSAMILLLVNPFAALVFILFIIVLQQFDGNYLGPKILGNSTGLPALWVLVAIIVGGGVFGFPGMVLGVPAAAVLYTLCSDLVARQLRKKGMGENGLSMQPQEAPPPEEGE